MRIQEFALTAYGPFTDVTLDLSGGSHGLHFIYGDNEAGKSSALRAMQAALFGIPVRTEDNFRHPNARLRVGATLQNVAGETLTFLRRKGNKETLLNPNHPQGAAHPDAALVPFLQGVDGDSFGRIFAIGHDVMRAGGEELLALRGLVGESLFAASVGGPGLTQVMDALHGEAQALFTPRKKNILKVASDAYRNATARRSEAQMRITRWQELRKDLEAAIQQREQIIAQLKELRTSKEKFERMRTAMRSVVERQRLLEQKERLRDAQRLPEEYSSEKRAECQSELEVLKTRMTSLSSEIDGPEGLRDQLKSISIPDGLIGWETDIAELQERRGAIVKAAADSKRRQRECDQLQTRIQMLLADVAPQSCLDDVEALRIQSDQREAIRSLANEEQLRRQGPADKRRERARLEALRKSHDEELLGLGAATETAELKRQVVAARKLGDLDAALREQQLAVDAAENDARQQLKNLTLWVGTLEEVDALALPLRDTIDRFDHEFTALASETSQLEENRREQTQQHETMGREIAALRGSETVPSESDLQALREQRDQLWEVVRGGWLRGEEPPGASAAETAADYAKQVAQADALADRLRREADRVAQLADRLASQRQVEQRLEQLAQQAIDLEGRRQQLDLDWQAAWETTGLEQALSPREMRGWLERCEALRQTTRDLARQRAACNELTSRRSQAVDAVRAALPAGAEDAGNMTILHDVLAVAEQILEAEAEAEQRRTELQRDLRRVKLELEQAMAEETQVTEAWETWQIRWQESMRVIGCPDDAPGDQAHQRLRQLDELFQALEALQKLQQRIEQIHEDETAFAEAVNGLAAHLAPDRVGEDAVEVAVELRKLTEAAGRDAVRQAELQATLKKRVEEITITQQRISELSAQLQQFCRMAGVSDEAALSETERQSAEFAGCEDRLAEINQQLGALCIDGDVGALMEEMKDRSSDELGAEIAALEDEIADAEKQRDGVVIRVRELENAREQVDGNATAAEADEEALGILAGMQEDAAQYARLRLAAELLKHQIEQHRAQNQDPLIDRAASLLAHLTCQAYRGLRTEYDADDQPHLVAVRDDGELVPVQAMSDGTRDQLFLALRLAYVERRLTNHEPLPLIVDDILIHFDDQRALATLQQLVELSAKTQVIFFTHHQHLVELATRHLPVEHVFLHQLDGHHEAFKLEANKDAEIVSP